MYDQYDWEGLYVLTRERRAQTRDGTLPSWVLAELYPKPCIRHGPDAALPVFVMPVPSGLDYGGGRQFSPALYRAWKKVEWVWGRRTCHYCQCELAMKQGQPNSFTVDHAQPLNHPEVPGPDHVDNWRRCCLLCNTRKGVRTEAEFFALLARDLEPVQTSALKAA